MSHMLAYVGMFRMQDFTVLNNATCINQAAARVRIDGEGVPEVRLHQLEHLHGKLHSCQCHDHRNGDNVATA